MTQPMQSKKNVLCVDLDGTLLHTDTMWELVAALLHHKPFFILILPFWLLKGRPHLKHKLAQFATPQLVNSLPVNKALLKRIEEIKNEGHPLWLVTAADQHTADLVADRFKIFEAVIGSDGVNNLKGQKKAHALISLLGERNFDYAGDSKALTFPLSDLK